MCVAILRINFNKMDAHIKQYRHQGTLFRDSLINLINHSHIFLPCRTSSGVPFNVASKATRRVHICKTVRAYVNSATFGLQYLIQLDNTVIMRFSILWDVTQRRLVVFLQKFRNILSVPCSRAKQSS